MGGKVKASDLMRLVVFAVLVAPGAALAFYNSPTLLFDNPTADVLPKSSLAISASVTGPLTQTADQTKWWEADANVRFSPIERFDFAVTAYTLKDYVLDLKYRFVGSEPDRFGLARGIADVGIHSYVSPLGSGADHAWFDWGYRDTATGRLVRTHENFSAYAVTSIPLAHFARLHLGLGRGRFVGYDGPNRFLNTDIVFGGYNDWAVALFGGMEFFVTPNVALVAEANTRDLNSGVKASFGPWTATVAWKKMEGLLFVRDWLPKGHEFGRIAFGASYKVDLRRHAPVVPSAPTPPEELIPVPEQPPAPPIAEVLRLYPIWFMWDKWDITPVAAATLKRNAEVILAHPEIKLVTVLGYASEEGTLRHNIPLSGRRAKAAFDYLVSLGVPAEKMVTKAMGESMGRPLPMHRSVYFEIELEK